MYSIAFEVTKLFVTILAKSGTDIIASVVLILLNFTFSMINPDSEFQMYRFSRSV